MNESSPSLRTFLLHSKSASEFLGRAEAHLKKSETGFSYADFARRAGFSARSYVREVFQGRKNLTLKALPAFAKALRLRREEREVFRCLLAIEVPGFDPLVRGEESKRRLQEKLKHLRRRLERVRPASALSGLADLENWPAVYAGLGDGTDFVTLVRRTKLSALSLKRALNALVESGVICLEGDRYIPTAHHLVLSPEVHAAMIQKHFHSVLTRSAELAKTDFRNPERMFFVSSYGVRKDRLPELKAKLIETLLRFVDESETDETPDQEIVSIAASLI